MKNFYSANSDELLANLKFLSGNNKFVPFQILHKAPTIILVTLNNPTLFEQCELISVFLSGIRYWLIFRTVFQCIHKSPAITLPNL